MESPDRTDFPAHPRITAYLAAPGFEQQLIGELRGVLDVRKRLVIAEGPPQRAHWALNVWLEPARIPIASVGEGARKLRAIQRNWELYSSGHHRRAALIQESLPHVSAKPLAFPSPAPSAPLGSWTLLERDLMLASPRSTSPFPNGEATFVEFKVGPPTRAYLKLWEALTLLGAVPAPGSLCLDAGCSPGGWTWALARLGAKVLSVDRAPLHPDVAALSGVTYRRGSAFSLRPPGEGPFDWILSDVVCYPERLWEWVKLWLESGRCGNFVCTVKFQGESRYGVVEELAAVPGSHLVHLWANKHELTWMRLGSPEAAASLGSR